MHLIFLKLYFIRWYYSIAFVDLYRNWITFLWFIYHFFSLPLLIRTLLSPWRRMGEERTKKFDLPEMLSTSVVNLLMRLVGVFIRLIFICIGTVSLLAVFVFGVFSFFLWAVLPFLLVLMLVFGISLFVFV